MGLKEFKPEDKIKILNAFSENVEQMFFLVDKHNKVHYFNSTFARFFKLDPTAIFGHDYGDALNCKYISNTGKSCTFSTYCSICEIKQNLQLIFNKTKTEADFDIVREFKILKEMLVKHLNFKIIALTIENETYALCIIKDLRERDNLKMFLNPDDSI